MKRAPIPVPLVLDLWSLGHSAIDIQRKLGIKRRHDIELILRRARQIGDKRAVYHVKGGRILDGLHTPREPEQTHYRGFELIERLPKPMCSRGHLRTPHNVTANGHCRQCRRKLKQ